MVKRGKNPIFNVENPTEYIKGFNWLPLWIDIYFFNKVSDFILGLVAVMIVTTIVFFKRYKTLSNINVNNYLLIGTIFLFLFEWFYNHPSLRYGGYCLIVILVFFQFSIFLSKYDNSLEEKNKVYFYNLFSTLNFCRKKLLRINDEMKKYSFKPISETYYKIEKTHLRINKKFTELMSNKIKCENKKIDCNPDLKPKMKKSF